MPENRNSGNGLSFENRGTVCIDTYRVLDCCRDRDCFEDTRVYLTNYGEDIIANATGIRTKSAKMLWAFVGVDEVPFNNGFYQVTVRYYVQVECEACLGIGHSQTFTGIAILEKDVILYGGEGRVTSYSSSAENKFCSIGNFDTVSNNDPIAIVESVEPIVLGTKIECDCKCCRRHDFNDIPEKIRCALDGELILSDKGPHLYISFGVFSVIRIQRPAQLLVQATDYSVPDKECTPRGTDDSPCSLFRTIAFPIHQFTASPTPHTEKHSHGGGCGCIGRNN